MKCVQHWACFLHFSPDGKTAANLPQKICSSHVFFRTSNIRRWTKRNCCNFRMLKIIYFIQRIDLGHSLLKENWSLQIFLASLMTVLWENVCLAALNLANRSWIDNVYKFFSLLQCLIFVRLLFSAFVIQHRPLRNDISIIVRLSVLFLSTRKFSL